MGHLQQGGNPSPFDRIQATRLAASCVNFLLEQADQGKPEAAFIGLERGQLRVHQMENFPRLVEAKLSGGWR